MSTRRVAAGTAVVLTAVALISLIMVLNAGGSGIGDEVAWFNSCIGRSRFLAITKYKSHHRLIEPIRDRARRDLVGEFVLFPSMRSERGFTLPIGPPSGNGAGNGRLLVVTAGIVGRDANAIIGCERAPAFPLT